MNYLLFILVFFSSCLLLNENKSPFSEVGKQVDQVLSKTIAEIEKKYNLVCSGVGDSMPDGIIKSLELHFKTKKELTRNELRELLYKCAQEMVAQAKLNGKIEDYLENPPFEIKNVEIVIFNTDRQGREVYDPEVSTAELYDNILTYLTVDRDDDCRYKNRYQETYEEALAIIQSQQD